MKEYQKPLISEEEYIISEDVLANSGGSLNNNVDNDGRNWGGIIYF